MSEHTIKRLPYLGFGLGLRTDHYLDVIEQHPPVDWFEIITENYLVPGGKPLYYLDKVKEQYPLVMHGVSMSLGSTAPLNLDYLQQVKALAKRIDAKWVSDHLCWTGVHGKNLHDLLPLPYTEETLNHVVGRIKQAQDILERRMLIENASTYVTFSSSTMTEWDFLTALLEAADCYILLDINNIYVSAFNHDFDAHEFINAIPVNRVQQIHLAGHTNNGDHIVDTHDHDVIDPVWDLYRFALKRFGAVSTMIERDDHIPPLQDLIQELATARQISQEVLPHVIETSSKPIPVLSD